MKGSLMSKSLGIILIMLLSISVIYIILEMPLQENIRFILKFLIPVLIAILVAFLLS